MARNPRPKLAVFKSFECPDCLVPHKWERLGQRSKLLAKYKNTTARLYGWTTTECHGHQAKDGRLYIEALG